VSCRIGLLAVAVLAGAGLVDVLVPVVVGLVRVLAGGAAAELVEVGRLPAAPRGLVLPVLVVRHAVLLSSWQYVIVGWRMPAGVQCTLTPQGSSPTAISLSTCLLAVSMTDTELERPCATYSLLAVGRQGHVPGPLADGDRRRQLVASRCRSTETVPSRPFDT
jgi:hypothetical protein